MLSVWGTQTLGLKVAALLAQGLHLPADFFTQHFSASMSALRLLHYAPERSNVASGVLAAGAHSDYGLLTFLATDAVPGLEVGACNVYAMLVCNYMSRI